MSDFSTQEEEAATDAMHSDDETTTPIHLWIKDGDKIVCTECGIGFEDWVRGTAHVL